jgi:hypothetical protein
MRSGPAGDRGEDHVPGRVHELRVVVLADVERVDFDRFGEHRLLDRVADHVVAADRLAGRVDGDGKERVEAKFEFMRPHRLLSAPLDIRVDYHDSRVSLW